MVGGVGDPRWWVGDVVSPGEFVSQEEAADVLGLRSHLTIGVYIARGILQPARTADGNRGVTRSSLDTELEWQRTASTMQRLRRRLGGLLHFL